MDSTLTLRLSSAQRAALKRRAKAEGKSESALVREILTGETQRGFDFERVLPLIGGLNAPPRHGEENQWRKKIRERNWRS